MKKDRNCNMNMPVYPGYMPGMMPMGNPSMFYNSMDNMNYGSMDSNYGTSQSSSYDQQFSNLNTKISSLERRISNLEGLIGNNNTTYNTTNYQML